MASILDILNENGLTVVATSSGRGIDSFVRSVYNELENGKYVVAFTHDSGDEMPGLFASAEEVENGNAVVLRCTDSLDVEQLRRKIHYRSTLNVDKAGKPRAKLTLGAATLSDNIADANGVAVGFIVR
jgi:metal-dependent hydrolase (beta-lactamase superfamily II)